MYTPLSNHSYFSLLNSTSSPEQISVRMRQIESKSCALTDLGTLSGIPAFIKALTTNCKHCGYKPERHLDGKGSCTLKGVTCTGYEKDPIKPIIGEHFLLCWKDPLIKDKDNESLSTITILSKNLEGWKSLIEASTESNKPKNFHKYSRLNLEKLSKFDSSNWIILSGSPRTELANICFSEPKLAYASKTYEEVKSLVKNQKELKKDLLELVSKYKDIFKNFYLQVQLIDKKNFPASQILTNIFRWVSKELNIKCVATPDPYYVAKEFAADQRVLLCSDIDSSLEDAPKKLIGSDLNRFFTGNNYHIPAEEEMIECGHTKEELLNTNLIADECSTYDIFDKPKLPNFICPVGKTPDEYMRELCREGWKRKVEPIIKKNPEKLKEYSDRIKEELIVLSEAGLSSYFLIVQDFVNYGRKQLGCPRDPGRGSVGGCLVSHLLDITDCDPIRYELSFSRFYNAARKASVPDIDVDFPSGKRDLVIDYVRKKYGDEYVSQMSTLNELQGREALSTVFRAHSWGNFEERKKVTAFIPDKAAISDDLQEMMEESGEASILRWTLENVSGLKQYCEIKEDESLEGPLAKYFEQAIRLEGVKRCQGRHPSGIIISPVKISEICPMAYDKNSDRLLTAFDMYACESVGLVKFDFLGVAVNEKIADGCKWVKYGRIE